MRLQRPRSGCRLLKVSGRAEHGGPGRQSSEARRIDPEGWVWFVVVVINREWQHHWRTLVKQNQDFLAFT